MTTYPRTDSEAKKGIFINRLKAARVSTQTEDRAFNLPLTTLYAKGWLPL